MVNDLKTARLLIEEGVKTVFAIRYEDSVSDVGETADCIYR